MVGRRCREEGRWKKRRDHTRAMLGSVMNARRWRRTTRIVCTTEKDVLSDEDEQRARAVEKMRDLGHLHEEVSPGLGCVLNFACIGTKGSAPR